MKNLFGTLLLLASTQTAFAEPACSLETPETSTEEALAGEGGPGNSGGNTVARKEPLAWKNPVKCTVMNMKATTKTIMDIDIDDPTGMDQIMDSKHKQLELKLQDSQFGVGRKALHGSYEVDLDDKYKVKVSVVIDPSMAVVKGADEMLVNSFLIDKATGLVVNSQFDKASHFFSGSPNLNGTKLLATQKLMMNNDILSHIQQSLLVGRITSHEVDDAMKKLVTDGTVKEGSPWKVSVSCDTMRTDL